MKKTLIGFILFAFILLPSTVQAKNLKRYTVKSAIVEYTLSGSQKGKETLYFDNYGANEARYSEMNVKIFGINSASKNLALMDGDWMYTIDLKEKQGTKMNIKKAQELAMKGMQNQTLQNYGKEAIKKMGGVREGTEAIAGKTCQIYSFPKMNLKVWLYKNIPLKSMVSTGGMELNYTAQSIKENVAIPKEKLSIPQGITITDAPDMSEAMKNFDMGNMFGNSDMQEDSQEMMEDETLDVEETNSNVKKAFGLFKSMME